MISSVVGCEKDNSEEAGYNDVLLCAEVWDISNTGNEEFGQKCGFCTYEYNDNGLRTEYRHTDYVETFEYNDDGTLKREGTDTHYKEYTYYENGVLKKIEEYYDNKLHYVYEYDEHGNSTKLILSDGDFSYEAEYEYYDSGKIKHMTNKQTDLTQDTYYDENERAYKAVFRTSAMGSYWRKKPDVYLVCTIEYKEGKYNEKPDSIATYRRYSDPNDESTKSKDYRVETETYDEHGNVQMVSEMHTYNKSTKKYKVEKTTNAGIYDAQPDWMITGDTSVIYKINESKYQEQMWIFKGEKLDEFDLTYDEKGQLTKASVKKQSDDYGDYIDQYEYTYYKNGRRKMRIHSKLKDGKPIVIKGDNGVEREYVFCHYYVFLTLKDYQKMIDSHKTNEEAFGDYLEAEFKKAKEERLSQ